MIRRKLIKGVILGGFAALSAGWVPEALAQTPADNGLTRPAERRGGGDKVAPKAVEMGGPWLEFSFGAAGSFVQGCSPADPAGAGCTPSSAGNSVFAGPPPYSFEMPDQGGTLKVTDAFLNGDEFEVFDFGISLGRTSSVQPTGACGDDPDLCSKNPAASSGSFALGPGKHQITLQAFTSPFGSGAAYLRVDPNPGLDHLTCYKIISGKKSGLGRPHPRKVILRNQFGEEEFIVLQPETLCVPTEKELVD